MTEVSEPTYLKFVRNEMQLSDGRAVVSMEEAHGPHPHPDQKGRIVPIRGVVSLLVDDGNDGVELFACDFVPNNKCGKVFDSVRSVVGHMPQHVDRPNNRTSEQTIRIVIRECRKAQQAGHRNYAEIVANKLNEAGTVKPFRANEWTKGSVSSLYREYKDKIRTHIRREPGVNDTPIIAPSNTSSMTLRNDDGMLVVQNAREVHIPTGSMNVTGAATDTPIDLIMSELETRISDVNAIFSHLRVLVHGMQSHIARFSDVNDEIRTKAEKYDDLMKILGKD